MSRELKLPELGENIETADVVAVLVSVGDAVQMSQPLIEVETEKASAEVPAESAGVIKEIHVKVGDKITVGQRLVTLDGEGEPAGEETKAAGAPPASADVGSKRARPHPREEMAPRLATPAQKTPVDEKTPGGEKTSDGEKTPGGEKIPGADPTHEAAAAAPSVRELARELGVEIDRVPGTGPGGRVSADDVQEYVRQVVSGTPGSGEGGGRARARDAAPALPDFTRWGEIRREPMSSVRRKTAEQTARSWTTIPHVTQFDHADMTELEKLRKRSAERVEAEGGKLTVTAMVLKVAGAALKRFPKFNASLDPEREEIIFKQYVHIGVAVDTDRGLLVPVIRDVDKKNLVRLAVELTQAAERARNRKIHLEELAGGCLSITNLGGLGTTYFTPIVNWPEVAVLGIGRARTEAVFAGGQFEPRLILPLSISYDHRVIDGADAARFLRWVAEVLEQPMTLVLEG